MNSAHSRFNEEMHNAAWRTSSRSQTSNCVEVARLRSGVVAVRDSKNRGGPVLVFPRGGWQAFVAEVREGGFDR